MGCEKYRGKLNEYLDGRCELPEEHLSVCADCANALEELRRVRSLVAGLSTSAPASVRHAVMARVQERAARKVSIWEMLYASSWARTALAGAAVLTIALISMHGRLQVAQPDTVGDRTLAAMADLHTQVQVAYVVPSDSPAPKGDSKQPAKDEYEDLYQVDGM
jgi:hypothetical protein